MACWGTDALPPLPPYGSGALVRELDQLVRTVLQCLPTASSLGTGALRVELRVSGESVGTLSDPS